MFGVYQPKLGNRKLPKPISLRSETNINQTTLKTSRDPPAFASEETLSLMAKFLEMDENSRTSDSSIMKQPGFASALIRAVTPPKVVTFNEAIVEYDSHHYPQWDNEPAASTDMQSVASLDFGESGGSPNFPLPFPSDPSPSRSQNIAVDIERLEKIASHESLRLDPRDVVSYGEDAHLENFYEDANSIQNSEDYNYNILHEQMYQDPEGADEFQDGYGDGASATPSPPMNRDNPESYYSHNLVAGIRSAEYFYPPQSLANNQDEMEQHYEADDAQVQYAMQPQPPVYFEESQGNLIYAPPPGPPPGMNFAEPVATMMQRTMKDDHSLDFSQHIPRNIYQEKPLPPVPSEYSRHSAPPGMFLHNSQKEVINNQQEMMLHHQQLYPDFNPTYRSHSAQLEHCRRIPERSHSLHMSPILRKLKEERFALE